MQAAALRNPPSLPPAPCKPCARPPTPPASVEPASGIPTPSSDDPPTDKDDLHPPSPIRRRRTNCNLPTWLPIGALDSDDESADALASGLLRPRRADEAVLPVRRKPAKRRKARPLPDLPLSEPRLHRLLGAVALCAAERARDLAAVRAAAAPEGVTNGSVGGVTAGATGSGAVTGVEGGTPSPPLSPRVTTGSPGGGGKRGRGGTTVPSGSTGVGGSASGGGSGGSGHGSAQGNGHASTNVGTNASVIQSQTQKDTSPGVTSTGLRERSPASSSPGELREMFAKHPDRKGWLVCRLCSVPVWPPNSAKHYANCWKR